MRTRPLGALLSVGLVGLYAAPDVASAAKVQIVYYHRSNTTEAEWAKTVIERFNKANPNIEVVSLPSGTGGGADYAEKLAVLRAGGNAPDVFFGSTDKLGYVLNGWTLDLTPFVQRDRNELRTNNFFPGVWETFTYNGRTHGIPLTVTPQLMFYNKDLFAKHGLPQLPVSWDDRSWTWDQMLEYAKKLTVVDANGSFTQLALTQATESHLPDVPWIFGGDWFEPSAYATGRATRMTLVTTENVTAYEAVRSLYERYAAAGPSKGISSGSGFVEGRVAMDWIGAWKMDSYISTRKSGGMNFNWGIAPVPLVKTRANTRWTDPLYISNTTAHPEAAWAFVKFATGEEGQALWSQFTGKIPARRSVVQTYVDTVRVVSGMTQDEILTAISGALAHSRRSIEESVADIQLEITRRRGEWIDPMLAGQKPVQSALAQMEAVMNAFLSEKSKR